MEKIDTNTTTILYLTFTLDGEIFAIDVGQVREVLDMCRITKVPGAADYMCGVINVRGSVVPVVDLRVKFGLDSVQISLDTRIIVMELPINDELIVAGAMADSVREVIELDPNQIEKPPTIGTRWKEEFMKGIGKKDEEFIIILDAEKLFTSDELITLNSSTDIAEMEEAVE